MQRWLSMRFVAATITHVHDRKCSLIMVETLFLFFFFSFLYLSSDYVECHI